MNDNDLNGSSLPEPCIIVIVGVTGDLARRELIPAFYEVRCRNLLPEPCAIVGFARRDWSDDKFREEMRAAVWESACKLGHWEEFARRMYYVCGNFDEIDLFGGTRFRRVLAPIIYAQLIPYRERPP